MLEGKTLSQEDLFVPHVDTLKVIYNKAVLHQQRHEKIDGHLVDTFHKAFGIFKQEMNLEDEVCEEDSDKKLRYSWPDIGLTWQHGLGGQNPSYLEFMGTFFGRSISADKKQLVDRFIEANQKAMQCSWHFSTVHIATDIRNVLPVQILPAVGIDAVCPINKLQKWYAHDELVFPPDSAELKKQPRDRDLRKAEQIIKTLTTIRGSSYQVQLYSKMHELVENKHTAAYLQHYFKKFQTLQSVTRCEVRIFSVACTDYLKLWRITSSEAEFCASALAYFGDQKKYRYRGDSTKTRIADWPVHPNWSLIFSDWSARAKHFKQIEEAHNITPLKPLEAAWSEKTPSLTTAALRHARVLKELQLEPDEFIVNGLKAGLLALSDSKTRAEKVAFTEEYFKKLNDAVKTKRKAA